MPRIKALFGLSHLWLILGLVLFLFSHGRWTIPLCSWFAFVFLIRFHRTSCHPSRAMVALWIGVSTCYMFMFDGLAPIKGLQFYAVCLLMGGAWVLPFIVDRLLYRRLQGSAATLIWPSLMVTINYFLAAYLPSLAHSQVDYLPLIQIVSITGMGGLVFVMYWFAAAINRIWESEFDWALAKREGSLFLGVLTLIVAYGETRLAFAGSHDETVAVAMINLQRNRLQNLKTFQPDIVEKLFIVSKQAADGGAKVIAWSEANADVPLDYEEKLIVRGKEFAKDNDVFLFMSYRSFASMSLQENKTLGISPTGEIVVDYVKSHLVPGIENTTRRGDGEFATAKVGDIRTGLCYDVDFPGFIQQAGKHDVDILFAPSSDWREVRFLHATSARFRAVENGCSLVRPTIQGLSIATDPYGRMLSFQDFFSQQSSRLSIVHVPSRGVRTIYSRCGDLFSILCVVMFLALLSSAYLKRDATPSATEP